MSNKRAKILDQPSYWVERVNGFLYDAIVTYMEKYKMKQKDLAKHLEVSPGRVSQILNDGDINFSLEKAIHIALKVDKYPSFTFEDKEDFITREKKNFTTQHVLSFNYNFNDFTGSVKGTIRGKKEAKVISIHPQESIAL